VLQCKEQQDSPPMEEAQEETKEISINVLLLLVQLLQPSLLFGSNKGAKAQYKTKRCYCSQIKHRLFTVINPEWSFSLKVSKAFNIRTRR
jgi:hypothetical protein